MHHITKIPHPILPPPQRSDIWQIINACLSIPSILYNEGHVDEKKKIPSTVAKICVPVWTRSNNADWYFLKYLSEAKLRLKLTSEIPSAPVSTQLASHLLLPPFVFAVMRGFVRSCGRTSRCDGHSELFGGRRVMMDKDVDYSSVVSTRPDDQPAPLSFHQCPTPPPSFIPPTNVSKQHDNHPPLSAAPCHSCTRYSSPGLGSKGQTQGHCGGSAATFSLWIPTKQLKPSSTAGNHGGAV